MRKRKANRLRGARSTKNTVRSDKSTPVLEGRDTSVSVTPKPETTGQTTSTAASQESTPFYHQWAKRWLQIPAWLVNLIVPSIISILLGFNPFPQDIPLITFVKQHPIETLVLGGGLLLITFIALILSHTPGPSIGSRVLHSSRNWPVQGWMIITVTSTISFILSSSLLALVLLRPPWCPTTLCPAPQVLTRGFHDANLDIYSVALQSSAYVIPGDPASYSQSDLPQQVGAQRIDNKSVSSSYRVVLGVQNLRQGTYNMIIEQVALVIDQVQPMPRPLNVWVNSSPLDYHTNLYHVVYVGQETGETLVARYASLPYGYVELAPGEVDQLDVQVNSQVLADLRFRVQVTYRVSNEAQQHTLIFPKMFEVIFSDSSNWDEYKLRKGHFEIAH